MITSADVRPVAAALVGSLLRVRRPFRLAVFSAVTVALMTMGAAIMLAVAVVTLFRARRFYAEFMAKWLGRAILWLWGVRLVVHQDQPFQQTQTIYISNHTSTLDVFVLISLGLPNVRYFLSGFLRKFVPLGVIGYLIGIFWTFPQDQTDKRVRCFQSAERVLRRTGESVYLSPEGERVTTGLIGHFNKGAFHLATSLGAPIVPFFIQIPRQTNPEKGFDARPGTVHVYVKPSISTRDWKLEDLERNRTIVRDMFVGFHEELKPT